VALTVSFARSKKTLQLQPLNISSECYAKWWKT